VLNKPTVTRANGQPAFGAYLRDPASGLARIMGLLVITVEGDRVSGIARFETATTARFGLPRTCRTRTKRPEGVSATLQGVQVFYGR
jgi:hypothetical protein